MNWARRAVVTGVLLMAGFAGSQPVFANLTGTYVAADIYQAFEIQMIETARKRLIGHYEEVDFNKAAQATTTDASVTGRVAGRLVIMTLKTHEFLSSPITLSGSFHGRHLVLQGGGGNDTMRLLMVKASQAVFTRAVAILRQHALVLAAVAQKNKQREERIVADHRLVYRLRKLIANIKTLPARGRVEIAYLRRADTAYRTITAQMRAGYSHELSIAPSGPYGQSQYARGQVSMKQFGTLVKGYAQVCRVRQENPKTVSSVADACASFLVLVPVFDKENAKIVKAFLRARATWRQQRPEQEAIDRQAQKGGM